MCVLLLITYVILICLPLFPASLRVSCLIVLVVVVLVVVPPLSHLVFLVLPQAPRTHLKRRTMEMTSISFCLPLGELCANVLSQNHCFFL